MGLFILVLKVNVHFRERTWNSSVWSQAWQEEGSSGLHHSSALRSGNHREGSEERSAFMPGTLCESRRVGVDSLCVQAIWRPSQHYSSLTPLRRSQRRLGRIQQSREQEKHRKPHNAESFLVKDQPAPCLPGADRREQSSGLHPEAQTAAQ